MTRDSSGQFTGYRDHFERADALAGRASRRIERAPAAWRRGEPGASELVRRARRLAWQAIEALEELAPK